MVHNEFHGELSGNISYCSFTRKTDKGQCIEWSTDFATTINGGATWQLKHAPLITLPRPYIKDAAIAGYGELGAVLYNHIDGFYYCHVSRSYRNNTGAGPPNTVGGGTCVFRTRDPYNSSDFYGWNGTDWSTTWTYCGSMEMRRIWWMCCMFMCAISKLYPVCLLMCFN